MVMVLIAAFATPLAEHPGGPTWLDDVTFWALQALLCWGGAWLGADFVPQGYGAKGLFARAVGRLLPLYAVVLLGFSALSFGWYVSLSEGSRANLHVVDIPMYGSAYHPLHRVAELFAGAFPFFACAAVIGSRFRRPPRQVITPATVVGLSVSLVSAMAMRLGHLSSWMAYLVSLEPEAVAFNFAGPSYYLIGEVLVLFDYTLGLGYTSQHEIPRWHHQLPALALLALDLVLLGIVRLAANGSGGRRGGS
ncbi:MAG: hypothetical protein ACK47B_11315 [Armatimonadota bacterium]